ncbi:hypothetical protein P7K49_030173, partial [Saguinus oedipus]
MGQNQNEVCEAGLVQMTSYLRGTSALQCWFVDAITPEMVACFAGGLSQLVPGSALVELSSQEDPVHRVCHT